MISFYIARNGWPVKRENWLKVNGRLNPLCVEKQRMNINKQKTVLGAALFFLMIGLVQFLLAAANVEESTEQERVAVLQANVPRTPEQLLQVFKDLLANPDVDGQEFCENRLGIGRESWTNSPPSGDLKKNILISDQKNSQIFPLSHFNSLVFLLIVKTKFTRLRLTYTETQI